MPPTQRVGLQFEIRPPQAVVEPWLKFAETKFAIYMPVVGTIIAYADVLYIALPLSSLLVAPLSKRNSINADIGC